MAYSYTTPAKVQEELKASTPFSGSSLPTEATVLSWIEQESEEVNRLSGFNIGSTAYSETIDYDGSETIPLKYSPVISVTSVLYSPYTLGTTGYALSDTKVENTDFVVYKDSGELVILFNKWNAQEGRKRIQINYTAGYSTIPLVIEKLVTKKVAKRVIDAVVLDDINQKSSGKTTSVGSVSITKASDFGVSQFKQLKEDIKELENTITKGSGVYRYSMRQ